MIRFASSFPILRLHMTLARWSDPSQLFPLGALTVALCALFDIFTQFSLSVMQFSFIFALVSIQFHTVFHLIFIPCYSVSHQFSFSFYSVSIQFPFIQFPFIFHWFHS